LAWDANGRPMTDRATTVRVSYPADLSDWGRSKLTDRTFRTYLGRVHEEAREGDEWAEFVDVGCCGDTLDVPLRVESVEGGPTVDTDTDFEFVERAACGIEGGWAVQSDAAPGDSEQGDPKQRDASS